MNENWLEENKLELLEEEYNCVCKKDIDPNNNSFKLLFTFPNETKIQVTYNKSDISEGAIGAEIIDTKLDAEAAHSLKHQMNQAFSSAATPQVEAICKVVNLFFQRQINHLSVKMTNHLSASSSSSSSKQVQSSKKKKAILAPNFCRQLESSDRTNVNFKKNMKKPSMKTAQNVINRIKWDKHLQPSNFIVGYDDRFKGIIEKSFVDFDWDSDLSSVGPDVLAIPQHRIQYFKYRDRIVWNKKNRLDDFFGSTGSKRTIVDVIDQYQPSESLAKSTRDDTVQKGGETTMSKSNENSPAPSSPIKKKPRREPTHFIGVRVNRTDVSDNVKRCVQCLARCFRDYDDEETFFQSVVDVEKLHVTLCICTVDNEAEIQKIQEVLEKMYVYGEKLKLNIFGVHHFDQAIIYAKIHSGQLMNLQNHLMRALQAEQINLSGNYPRYIPHMTMVKLPYRSKYLFKKISNLLTSKKMNRWSFVGRFDPVVIDAIDLCKMKSIDPDNDNFYEIDASSPLVVRPAYPDYYSSAEMHRRERSHDRGFPRDGRDRRNESNIFFSKSLSAILRHNKFGFQVDSEGYVDLDSILRHQRFRGATRETIRRIVESNDKKRFTIVTENGVEKIKANQGHSVEVEDLELTEISDPTLYPNVVHGTFWPAWGSIKKQGLHRRSRIHIHMTTAEPSHDDHVISGMRKSCTVFVYVNLAAAMQGGIRFFLSSNGVILSPGDKRGYIAPKYFSHVIGLDDGKRICLLDEIRFPEPTEEQKATSSNGKPVKEFLEIEADVNSVVESLLYDIANLNLQQQPNDENPDEKNPNDENLDEEIKSVVEKLIAEVVDLQQPRKTKPTNED